MKRRMLLLSLLLSACLCIFFSWFSVSFFLPQRFNAAQAQWEASNIQSYEAVIAVAIPLSNFSHYRIVVNDGAIVEAGQRSSLLGLQGVDMSDYSADTFTPIAPTEASAYTFEELMSLAQTTVGNTPKLEIRPCGDTYWDAEYDSQYGYVSSLRFHCGGGFLGCTIGDCDGGYTVLSFTPLSP